ncbi:unnamed protein product [Urochloa humidicola]
MEVQDWEVLARMPELHSLCIYSTLRLSSAGCVESPIYDGHTWRMYGQKEIPGAKHPGDQAEARLAPSEGAPVAHLCSGIGCPRVPTFLS